MEQERDFGEGTAAVDLVEGGGSRAVTNDNRAQFVEVYAEHLLLKSVEKQRNAFCRGFHKVGARLRRLPRHCALKPRSQCWLAQRHRLSPFVKFRIHGLLSRCQWGCCQATHLLTTCCTL